MKQDPMAGHSQDTGRLQKVAVAPAPAAPPPQPPVVHEFTKLIEELKSLKNRSQSLDLGKLEDQHNLARDAAIKAVERKVGRGSSEDIVRLQSEAKKIVDAEHERSKEILVAKFSKIDTGLAGLSRFLQELGPVKVLEAQVHEQEARLKKMEEELRIQRKVLAHEQEELERDKGLFEAQENAIAQRQKELDARLANLEVVKRAKELDQQQNDLEAKLKAFDHEMAQVEKDREAINKDADSLGTKRAELDAEGESLATQWMTLGKQKSAMAEAVAREMALTFEAFVRDMLKPAAEAAEIEQPKSAKPAAPAPAPKQQDQAPDPDAPKKSDFWQ
jgi:DNA repair exonuclease SbcCD ATPase subunit